MKVTVLMSASVDGFVAGPHDDVSFVSVDAWKNYLRVARKSDAVVIGRKTYDVIPKKEFVAHCPYFVISHKSNHRKKAPNVYFWKGSARLLMKELRASGAKKVLIAGGGETNSLFLNEKLVDELAVDIEGLVLGQGVKLFSRLVKKVDLKLLSSQKVGKNTIRLQFGVKK